MSYRNPNIKAVQNPLGVDMVIEKIREQLSVLPWLEKSFGRAYDFPDVIGERTVKMPKCYSGKGEYLPVLPNDNLNSQSFIQAINSERIVDFVRHGSVRRERDLAIIFWYNTKKVAPGRDEVLNEELRHQVEEILLQVPEVQSINNYTDEKPEEVFRGYYDSGAGTLSLEDDNTARPLMWPFSGFRYEVTVNYRFPC